MRVVADLTERELIARIQQTQPPPPDWLLVGIGDDAAVIEPERNRVEVLTVDSLVEGVHFDRAFVPPEAIGHRALAVNLSDLAAMGAAPRLALLSLALPPSLPLAEFDGIVQGFSALARRHHVHIVGGNLTRSPGDPGLLMIDVTVAGGVKRRQALTRDGARPGDELYVTGTIGAAAAGLRLLREFSIPNAQSSILNSQFPIPNSRLISSYLRPEPRVRVGTLLARNRAAKACIDLSDGLADAVRQIAEASHVGAAIDAGALPIEPGARDFLVGHGLDAVAEAIAGGDDYELLFAVRPRVGRRLEEVRRHGEVLLTRIGMCTEERSVTIQSGAGTHPLPVGYHHFR